MAMPVFQFHLSDGAAPADPVGVEYADVAAAQAAGVKYLGQLLSDHGDQFWRSGDWQLVVSDESGLTLFTVQVLATQAPAVQVEIIARPTN
jgi:hypothetical protein